MTWPAIVTSLWLNLATDCVSRWLGPSGAPASGSVYHIFCKGLEGSSRGNRRLCCCSLFLGLCLPSSDQAVRSLLSSVWIQFRASTPHPPLPENQKYIRLASFHRPPEPLHLPQNRVSTAQAEAPGRGPAETCEQRAWARRTHLLLPPKHQFVLTSCQKSSF